MYLWSFKKKVHAMLYSSHYCEEQIANLRCIDDKNELAFHEASRIAFESHPEISFQIMHSADIQKRPSEEKSVIRRCKGQLARYRHYQNEFIALRIELFGIAWAMRFGFEVGRTIEHAIGIRGALEDNDRLEIWEATAKYNRAVGQYVSTALYNMSHKQKNWQSAHGLVSLTTDELEQRCHLIHTKLSSFLTSSNNDPEFYQQCTVYCEQASQRVGLAKKWSEVPEGLPWHLSDTFYKALNVNVAPGESRVMCGLIRRMYTDILNDLSRVHVFFAE